ncbi:MAG: tRNA (adenosine(37)-N6)-threonylcarbamoyltransferase complex transferase subunit TsaD [Anaerolineae bacterium]|uniref:tRNA (adenosine(37)-N6)-threonylcarbamoyltransferase complex transferase subunit TsaD n=1 Tax=Candidatus Amarolinea dominans TaxID=3140696 RepID=UPI0031360CE3|nr:tRNA (adenosine(37)-N6)-threonylcarbamoyltransferase complex transferase subunit TsaD [Anaerolineae bacterium]MBK9233109.1 tRNA (adenosine(37)-N6)-threonylcarbamoyltransferase complex transferase subunit TsaD [Anaerolineae bacterium]
MTRLILGIETSCDETAAAVVGDGQHILSNVVATQIDLHRQYGGVFPELASRQHILTIKPVIEQALTTAQVGWQDIAAVAVTYGPGLAGSLLVGVNAAKGLAWARALPLIGVNHLEGHIYANWLRAGGNTAPPVPPVLVLIVSGGHTELILMHEHGRYTRLGATLDDAAGEVFDKVARLLGLGYPGGPALQRAAEGGRAQAFDLPLALRHDPKHRYNFSFSGLKTAVLRLTQALKADGAALPVADLAASFQRAVAEALVARILVAVDDFKVSQVCVCGGVAANVELRRQLAARLPVPHAVPPIWLCTDNAAMIASAGFYRYAAGQRSAWDLDVLPNLKLN